MLIWVGIKNQRSIRLEPPKFNKSQQKNQLSQDIYFINELKVA